MGELFEEHTFQHLDWYGAQLTDHYVNCTFNQLDLTEASIQSATFTECTFNNVKFNASHNNDSAFLRCIFANCNFFDATFTDCKMVGSSFRRCELRPLHIHGGDWSFVSAPGADLRGSTIEQTRMREVDFTKANCEKSTFINVDFSGAQFLGANFTQCDLRGSDLSSLNPRENKIEQAIVDANQCLTIASALGFTVL